MKQTNAITNFDPDKFLVVPEKKFDDLKIGDIFRAPSRTLTDAHAVAFQSVSADNHRLTMIRSGRRGTAIPLRLYTAFRCLRLRPREQRFFRTTLASPSLRSLSSRAPFSRKSILAIPCTRLWRSSIWSERGAMASSLPRLLSIINETSSCSRDSTSIC
jgi:hypothetical protein